MTRLTTAALIASGIAAVVAATTARQLRVAEREIDDPMLEIRVEVLTRDELVSRRDAIVSDLGEAWTRETDPEERYRLSPDRAALVDQLDRIRFLLGKD